MRSVASSVRGRLRAYSIGVVGALVLVAAYAASPALGVDSARSPAVARLLAGPHLLFNTSDTRGGRLGVASLAKGHDHVVTGLDCQRVAFSGGRGVCLVTAHSATAEATGLILDSQLHVVRVFRFAGVPFSIAVRGDGLVAAFTTSGKPDNDTVGQPPPTATTFIDLQTGKPIAALSSYTLLRHGRRSSLTGWYSNVTFDERSPDRFYAELMTQSNEAFLVRGSFTSRTLTVVRAGVESPALSPNGTRLAYVPSGTSRLAVLSLHTGRSKTVAQRRKVEGQPAWLNGRHLIYAAQDGAHDSLWTISPAGSRPSPFLAHATSPAVVVAARRR
jgi:hypothetical protein